MSKIKERISLIEVINIVGKAERQKLDAIFAVIELFKIHRLSSYIKDGDNPDRKRRLNRKKVIGLLNDLLKKKVRIEDFEKFTFKDIRLDEIYVTQADFVKKATALRIRLDYRLRHFPAIEGETLDSLQKRVKVMKREKEKLRKERDKERVKYSAEILSLVGALKASVSTGNSIGRMEL